VLGGARSDTDDTPHSPGVPVVLRPDTPAERVDVLDPENRPVGEIDRNAQGTFVVTQAEGTGVYRAKWGDEDNDRLPFAVNLFDPRESDLSTRGQVPAGVSDAEAESYKIKIGHTPVDASRDTPAEHEWWWPLTLLALGVLIVEWVVYNKRVFV
jgi:hypothetical protein